MLFSRGTASAGRAPVERWQRIVDRARKRGDLIGTDPETFPRDIGIYGRYHAQLQAMIPARYPLPGYLPIDRVAEFIQSAGDRYQVRWVEEDVTSGDRDTAACDDSQREPAMLGRAGEHAIRGPIRTNRGDQLGDIP